jgi:hypothetical protein
MRKVHTGDSVIDVLHLRNLLEQAGIACFVRNERLGGVVGEIPFLECWPELWVVRPGDALRARGVIDLALRADANDGETWTCPACGERIEAAFTECWRCADNGESTP